MNMRWKTLREDARGIWDAGVHAVDSQRLVEKAVRLDGNRLSIQEQTIDISDIRRIVVIGAGKAGAGMAAGLEQVLHGENPFPGQVEGWINVPSDCLRPLQSIHLHAARPAGLNEPTPEGVKGSERILDLLENLEETDLCICLLSGGGSALLPAPLSGISLADKQHVTQFLSGAGANIQQLNTVRKQLSATKGGRLAAACRAPRLATLIISDVPGDPLDIIASGPTVKNTSCTQDAIDILDDFKANQVNQLGPVYKALAARLERPPSSSEQITATVSNHIIGNNQIAVEAALAEARKRGYKPGFNFAVNLEGSANEVGRQLVHQAQEMKSRGAINCWISGGEPTVQLAPSSERGRGGRNQQLVLAALVHQREATPTSHLPSTWKGLVLLSGGTDGEDGPTDAAGAYVDELIARQVQQEGHDPRSYLERNDAYTFFEPLQALVKTGPTHTNVCDLRVLLVDHP